MIDPKVVKYFSGKTVWLTGASSGIGEAMALMLDTCGAKLILTARRIENLQSLLDRMSHSKNHLVLPCDLSNEDQILDAWKKLGDTKIDVLISNAGCSQRSLAMSTSLDTSRYLMEINFFAPVQLMKLVLPKMLDRDRGHIIVVGSLMGKIATPLRSSYAAAKHALIGYFDCVLTENYKSPIAFTMVNPGFIDTEISKNSLDGTGSVSNDIHKKRKKIMSAEECAKRILIASSKGEREVYIGGLEIYIALLKRLFPRLFFELITRVSATR